MTSEKILNRLICTSGTGIKSGGTDSLRFYILYTSSLTWRKTFEIFKHFFLLEKVLLDWVYYVFKSSGPFENDLKACR